MRTLQRIASFVLLLIAVSHSRASNNYFMPGDAFFHVTVTEELLDSLEKQQPPYVWDYSLRDTFEMAFCGYAGYEKATVEMADKQFLANLRNVYNDVRQDYSKEIRETRNGDRRVMEETNGLHLFFYRDDFDIHNYRNSLVLRYNERWREECLKFGDIPRLCCFLDSAWAVEVDWRDGELVPGLDVKLPEVEIQQGQAVTAPIHILGKVKAIVLPTSELQQCFDQEDGCSIYVLDAAGTEERIANNRKWLSPKEWETLEKAEWLGD